MSNRNTDFATLAAILRVARPHDTERERQWCRDYIDGTLGALGYAVEIDGAGNRWINVPGAPASAPAILFSCHVDTMDSATEDKGVVMDSAGIIRLKKGKPGRCLGADDGAGVWLLSEMIRAGVPGTYVFHRGEERGRIGSLYVAKSEAFRLEQFDICIAFDRRGTSDIITHQMAERGCSETFAKKLAGEINNSARGALRYRPDDSGSYTDSYSYFDLIPECTNVSIGYSSEHGPRESLDFAHIVKLRDALLGVQWSALPVERDPSRTEYLDWGGYGGGYGAGGWGGSYSSRWHDDDDAGVANDGTSLETLCFEYPDVAAALLDALGISRLDFLEELAALYPGQASRAVAAADMA
jgi:hypothetical protein